MVSIVTKKISGKEYLYLVESQRYGAKVVQKTIKYIGKKRPISREEFLCMEESHQRKDWVLGESNDLLPYTEHNELKKLSTAAKEHHKTLDLMSREKERERFLSIFIANSNAIEGSTLTAKETFNYLFSDVVPEGHRKKELFMATNMLQAWEYMEKNCNKLPTSAHLFALHAMVNRNIEEERTLGKYKLLQNYIGESHTTSYLFTKERMAELLGWIKKAFRKMNDFEVAFQSHAQFEIIHPFIDGNGRVGRLLLNWLLLYKKLMPLAIRMERRNAYISALENARRGGVVAICTFCSQEYAAQYAFID